MAIGSDYQEVQVLQPLWLALKVYTGTVVKLVILLTIALNLRQDALLVLVEGVEAPAMEEVDLEEADLVLRIQHLQLMESHRLIPLKDVFARIVRAFANGFGEPRVV